MFRLHPVIVILFTIRSLAGPPSPRTFKSRDAIFKLEILRTGDDVLWGFDFLPDGQIVATERAGRILILNVAAKKETVVRGGPAVANIGQGGLLDIRLHPAFKQNHLIFLTYAEPVGQGQMTTALARAELRGNELKSFKKIFSSDHPSQSDIQFGSRIEFENSRVLYLSVGDRNERNLAQDLGSHPGKVLRLTMDGAPAPGNPFLNTPGAKPEIWTYGHRNTQGLAVSPRGQLFEAEFGPQGGDEVNILNKGANYGWPVITYGREYSGGKIGEGTHNAGMEQPVVYWVPSISPSALAFYTGAKFPKWKGDIFLGALSGTHLHRLVLNAKNEVIAQEKLLETLGWRIRNVRTGPDGYLYLSTDNGTLARLVPTD